MKKLERDDTDYQHEYYESSEVDKCIADLEAQLLDAKQVANDSTIVADNAVLEAQAAKKDAARYRLARLYKISGSWPNDCYPSPAVIAFTKTNTPTDLDDILDDMLAYKLPKDMSRVRPDYIEWRKASTQAVIHAAVQPKEQPC